MEKLFQKGIILDLNALVDYSDVGVVSKQILKSPAGNITLFSFDKGKGLSEHTALFDAMLQGFGRQMEVIALNAVERFKMLLTMIKE